MMIKKSPASCIFLYKYQLLKIKVHFFSILSRSTRLTKPVYAMRIFLFLISLFAFSFFSVAQEGTFKTEQKKHQKVRKAYKLKYDMLDSLLKAKGVSFKTLNVFIRGYKKEEKLEVWVKNKTDKQYSLLITYDFAGFSGTLGPKRMYGDGQIPEGFYYIDRFNPWSSFELSLGLNYPNFSDTKLGKQGSLGGNIFMHGSTCTIGCIPITDDKIRELYVLCVEAKNYGQNVIPVTILPARLNKENYEELKEQYAGNDDYLNLWADLKKEYDLFIKTKQKVKLTFLKTGRHSVKIPQ